jgi:hypothetical protein
MVFRIGKYRRQILQGRGLRRRHLQPAVRSTLHRIAFPFGEGMTTCTVEIWHPVHAEFETRAPIIRQLIREVNGEAHLYAVYGCTPLVRFPLAALKNGAHVRGDINGELGYP